MAELDQVQVQMESVSIKDTTSANLCHTLYTCFHKITIAVHPTVTLFRQYCYRVYDSSQNDNCRIAIMPKAVYVEWPLLRMESMPKLQLS